MGQTTTVFLTSICKFEPRPHTHICWVSIWRRPSQSLQDTSKFTQQVPAVWWVSGKSLPSSNQRWVLGGQSSSFIKMNTLSQLISDGHMWLAYPKSRLLTSTYRNVASGLYSMVQATNCSLAMSQTPSLNAERGLKLSSVLHMTGAHNEKEHLT